MEKEPSKKDAREACHMVPGFESSFPKSTQTGQSKRHKKFIGIGLWSYVCNLLSLNGADPVSAEMAFAMVNHLDVGKSRMHIGAVVFLCIMWGSQCGRGDARLKQDLMHMLGFDGMPRSPDMRQFGKTQLELLETLSFDVRTFGKTSIEIAQEKCDTLPRAIQKWCIALTFLEPHLSAAQRATIALAGGGMDRYRHSPLFLKVASHAGRLLAFYIKRSKEEEKWCAQLVREYLKPRRL